MCIQRRLLTCLICAGAGTIAWSQSTDTTSAQKFEYFATAVLTNLEQIVSGSGQMRVQSEGGYFAMSSPVPLKASTEFSFSHDKLRFDRTFEYDRLPKREAVNGPFYFEYMDYPGNKLPNARPDAYIRRAREPMTSAFAGSVIDVKRLMQANGPTMDHFLDVIHQGLALVEATDEPDGLVRMRIYRPDQQGDEFVFWFDPEQGNNLVREQRIFNSQILNDIKRTFQSVDGLWILRTLEFKRYSPDVVPEKEPEVNGVQTFEVESIRLNIELPESVFGLEGFGLNPRTHIWDTIAGVDYTLNPAEAVELQVSRIFDSLRASGIDPNASRATASQGKKDAKEINGMLAEAKTDNHPGQQHASKPLISETSAVDPSGGLRGHSRHLLLLAALAVAGIAGLTVVWRHVRTKGG